MISFLTLQSSFFAGLINRNDEFLYEIHQQKVRKTKITKHNMFKPPFNKFVSTNVAKTLLQMVTKHFS